MFSRILGFMLLVGALPAVGAPALQGANNAISAVDALPVQRALYDVRFSDDHSFHDVFGTGTPTFLGDRTRAKTARDALWVLFSGVASGVANVGLGPTIAIPYAIDEYEVYWVSIRNLAESGANTTNWIRDFGRASLGVANENVSFALFSPTSVPEPASLALIAVGLAGLGFARRRTGH